MEPPSNLTGLAVSRHKYPSPALLDGACPGLRLIALKPAGKEQQRGSWIYRYRTSDRRLGQIKLGRYPVMSLAEARKAWAQQKAIRDDPQRGDPRQERERLKAAKSAEAIAARQRLYSVEQVCSDYLEEHVEKQRLRSKEPRRLLVREVVPALGQHVAKGVTRAEAHTVIQAIIKRGAPRIAQMTCTELRAAFNHAVSAGRLPANHVNPCDGVKVPPYLRRTRAFTESEIAKFLQWLPIAKVSRSVRDVMLLELLTCARQGELVAMEWNDVDFKTGVWHQPTSKNKLSHEVMLSRQASEIIKGRQGLHQTWVFPRPDAVGHIASKAIGIQQYAAKEGLEVPDWTVHDLRRSAITGLARMRCPRVVQDRIANHTDRSIAAVYDRHSYDEEARQWLQRWADHLDSLDVKSKDQTDLARTPISEPDRLKVHFAQPVPA